MKKKSEKTEKMIAALVKTFESYNGSVGSTARQLVPEVEAHLGQTILEWDGKSKKDAEEIYATRRLSYFLQQQYRGRKEGRSERIVIKAGKLWIHKPLYVQYLKTLGKDGLEAALKVLLDAAQTLEPNIKGAQTIREGYLLTIQQVLAGYVDLEQLSLFANPEIEETAS